MKRSPGRRLVVLAAALIVSTSSALSPSPTATHVCLSDETEAVVALMASLLIDPNCYGVADDKCPGDAKCLERIARIVMKMPECTSYASAAHKSQRSRLAQLVNTCPAPPPAAADSSASKSAASVWSVGETMTRSTSTSSAASRSNTCAVGVAICTAGVAAAYL